MDDREIMDGGCHCGAVKFTVKLTGGFASARRCDCSYCRMRGAVAVSADIDDLTIIEGQDALTRYRFNSMTAEHFFCSTCGIHTHHRRRSNPRQYGINAACLAGVSPFDFECVPVYDGVTHPADRPADPAYLIAGFLKYERRR